MTPSNKQVIVDAANLELERIGAKTDDRNNSFGIVTDHHGRITAGDASGTYVCKNYKTLVSDLKEFADNSISDSFYDGEDCFIWNELWKLFQ